MCFFFSYEGGVMEEKEQRPKKKKRPERRPKTEQEKKEAARRRKRRIEQKRLEEELARKKQKKKKIIISVVVIVALIAVAVAAVFIVMEQKNSTKEKEEPKTSHEEATEEKTSFALNGAEEITLMLGSFYQEMGTTVEEAQIQGEVDTLVEGSYTLTYTSGEETLERVIHVINNKQIVLGLKGDKNTYVKQGQPYIESGCHARDMDEGNLIDSVVVSGEVNTAEPGDYPVIYTVTNSQGIVACKLRTVHVIPEAEFVSLSDGLPVLMYHFVQPEDSLVGVSDANIISDTLLAQELTYLKENGYYFPSFEELRAYVNGEIDLRERSVILTFDDAHQTFLDYGIPVLQAYEVPATTFVIGNNDNMDELIKTYANEYVQYQSHSYGMHTGGSGVGQGGIIHAMSKDEIIADLQTSYAQIYNTEAFCYPYGDNNENAYEALREVGALCAFTVEPGRVRPGMELMKLPRVRMFGNGSLDQFISQVQ